MQNQFSEFMDKAVRKKQGNGGGAFDREDQTVLG